MTPTPSTIKKTGATFTPEGLANFLAEKLITLANSEGMTHLSVLDPACGDGSLLHAINKVGEGNVDKLIGYDTNASYIEETKSLLVDKAKSLELECQDFLTVSPNHVDLFSVGNRAEFADLVIANPPYVRTQVLGAQKTQQLAHDFNLTGKIDLYYPFLMAMTNALKKGGLLGVITSNRYISTKSGSDIRKFLVENYEILEVIDLGDTKLFNAAVLPAIFIGKKKKSNKENSQTGKYASIYEAEDVNAKSKSLSSIYEILNEEATGHYVVGGIEYSYKNGKLKCPMDKTGIWQMTNEEENAWIENVNENAAFRIKDHFKVRVGIKSCADNVFICQEWEKMGLHLEKELLRPMISQENIEAWHINKCSIKEILYPHYSENGQRKVFDISKYPVAEKYLDKCKEQLEARKYVVNAGRKWYEYWVPQNPQLWKMPKVVFPDISVKPRFCYDGNGAVVNGNCYWICAQTEEERQLLLLIEGVANSELMMKYHDLCFNNKLYSGRRRYLTQYIEQYPMPDPHNKHAQDIIRLVNEINSTDDESQRNVIEREINKHVNLAFGFMD